MRFLRRTGHRYCYLPQPPVDDATQKPLASSPIAHPMALYACGNGATRVYLTTSARVEPDPVRQMQLLFDESYDPSTVVLQEPVDPPLVAPPAASTGTVRIVSETQTSLVIDANVPEAGAFLNVQDSYDPNWIAEVDGERQPLLRANGVFRAVRLAAGAHRVRFHYRPVSLYVGAAVTIVAGLLLLGAAFSTRGRQP